jgi:glycosyltransferase involved in cell wall biosynthesis
VRIAVNTLALISEQSGGSYVYLTNILSQLANTATESDQFYIFVSDKNRGLFPIEQKNFRFVTIKGPIHFQPYRILVEQSYLPFLVKKHKLDVFYNPWEVLPLHLACKKIMQIQNLEHFHGDNWWKLDRHNLKALLYMWAQRNYYRLMARLSVKYASEIIAVSENTRQAASQSLNASPNRMEVIYHGISSCFLNTGESAEKLDLGFKYILYVSAILRYKNMHRAIQGLNILRDDYQLPHHLLVIGSVRSPGYMDYLRKLTEDLDLSKYVHFLDHIPQDRLVRYYRNADLFIFPSACESFGIPMIEAMACEVPIIASNKSSVPEIAGDASIIVDPDDIETFAQSMFAVLTDSELRDSLIEKGKKRVQMFSWERNAMKLLSVFKSL